MEQALYSDAYINVLYYGNVLEAYRSDVIGSMDKQPQPNGLYWGQDGYWAFWSAKPASAAAASSSSSSNTGLIAGIVIAMVVVVGGGGLVLMRRRRGATAEERE